MIFALIVVDDAVRKFRSLGSKRSFGGIDGGHPGTPH
jgi:hypothetical protein